MEVRCCIRCGAEFRVNPRAGRKHRYCGGKECQRERQTITQRERRRAGDQDAIAQRKAARADYMERYRAERPAYRERDATRRRDHRERRNDAGSSLDLAMVYMQTDPDGAIRVHVVTEGGQACTLDGARLTEESVRGSVFAV